MVLEKNTPKKLTFKTFLIYFNKMNNKNHFYKIIGVIIFFIISSAFPFYFITYRGATFTTIYIFSIWSALIQFILGYIVLDKRKLIFVIIFWVSYFIFVIGADFYGTKAIDPLLYGWIYGIFFLMCGFILYKWEIRSTLHDRYALIIFGYLFQGVYDWVWWGIQYLDPLVPPYGNWNDKFYVNLIVPNSTLFSVFIIELINLVLGIIIVISYPKENWDFLIFCTHWLFLQLLTIILSWNKINFPYIILYIGVGLSFSLYLLLKYKRDDVYFFFKNLIGRIEDLFNQKEVKILRNF